MSNCQCRIGFFTLRDCDRPAVAQCHLCQRGICSQHLDAGAAGGPLCLECAALEEQAGRLPAAAATSGGSFGGRNFFRQRDTLYRQQGYRPVYWGTTTDVYYDRYDYQSFHHHHHVDRVDDGDDDAGVSASLMDS
jgi:hypothetical protein